MEAEAAQHPHLRATLILSCLAQFMVILDVSVVNVALPAIRHGLGFSEQDLQWVVNAYTVTFAGFLLLGGRAADLLGRRRVFVSGLVLFALASLAGGLAQSQATLIAARAIQGLGGAVIAPASLSILTTTFAEGAGAQPRRRHLGRHGRRRRCRRRVARGSPHRPAGMALDPVHQRSDRADRRVARRAVHLRGSQRRPPTATSISPAR